MVLVVFDHDLWNAHKKSKIKILTSALYIETILDILMEALLSGIPSEDNVLFAMNTIFRLIDVENWGSI